MKRSLYALLAYRPGPRCKDNPLKAILVNRSGCGVDVKTGKGKVFLIFILFERLLSLAALE